MASYTENYGTFDALSGASSGGIADFIYESVLMSPVLHDCGDGKPECDEVTVRKRAGLMLKGFQGYIEYVGKDSPESNPFWVVKKFADDLKKKNVEELLLKGETIKAFFAVHKILEDKEVRLFINPEFVEFVDLKRLAEHKVNLKGLQSKLERLVATAKEGVSLKRSDPELLVRAGLPNMPQIMRLLGRIGDFYAGYGPPIDKPAWRNFFAACTDSSFRKPWTEIRKTPCGPMFKDMVKNFRSKLPPVYRTRADDQIGTFIPILNSSTMLLGKESVDAWKRVKQIYDDGGTGWEFKPEFDKYFRLGYWGNPADLKVVAANVGAFGDYKSKRFFALGERPWYQAMYRSASEPGLSHALPYDELVDGEEILTTGGWSDGHSVLVLKALKCEHVVYITRRGPDSNFAKGVAHSLQMSDADVEKLFGVRKSATPPYSSFETSVMNASAVWCTDWDNTKLDPDLLGDDGHKGIFQINPGDDLFGDHKRFDNPYPLATTHSGLLGCEVLKER
jgi:hypothetical protein